MGEVLAKFYPECGELYETLPGGTILAAETPLEACLAAQTSAWIKTYEIQRELDGDPWAPDAARVHKAIRQSERLLGTAAKELARLKMRVKGERERNQAIASPPPSEDDIGFLADDEREPSRESGRDRREGAPSPPSPQWAAPMSPQWAPQNSPEPMETAHPPSPALSTASSVDTLLINEGAGVGRPPGQCGWSDSSVVDGGQWSAGAASPAYSNISNDDIGIIIAETTAAAGSKSPPTAPPSPSPYSPASTTPVIE